MGKKKQTKSKTATTNAPTTTAATTTTTTNQTSSSQAPAQFSPDQIAMMQERLAELQKEQEEDRKLTQHLDDEMKQKTAEASQILHSNQTIDAKTQLLHNQVTTLLQENKKIKTDVIITQKKLDQSLLSKRSLLNEIQVLKEQKSKLESLCKDIYKENKLIQEKSKMLDQLQEDKRQEIAQNFQKIVGDIQQKLEQEAEERFKVMKENTILKTQIENILKQVELQEKQFELQLKHAEAEKQLILAKTREHLGNLAPELSRVGELQKQLDSKTRVESDLRKQLSSYTQKFDEIQKTIKNTSKSYKKLNKDMVTMADRIKTLEKEKLEMKNEAATQKLAYLTLEKRSLENEAAVSVANLQREKLRAFCKTLNAEKSKLQEELNALKGTPASTAVEQTPSEIEELQETAKETIGTPEPSADL